MLEDIIRIPPYTTKQKINKKSSELNKDNIELLCPEHHMEWETGDLETKRKFTWSETKKQIVKDYNYLLYCKLFGDD